MALQFGTTLRNDRASQLQVAVGGSGTLVFYSGAEPANCAAANPTGPLATIALPATFLTASGGVTTIAGTWSTTASATGTAQSWRIFDGSGTCHMQGNTTSDIVLNNTSIASGQTVTVTAFTFTDGNA
jgi:hypothetical protein